jgi:hypothetical protein
VPSSEQKPAPRFGACSVCVGTTVYYFGGFLDKEKTRMSNEMWSLSFDVDTFDYTTFAIPGNWTRNAAAADGRAFHGCYYSSPYIVAVGGVVGVSSVYSGSVMTFDLRVRQWTVRLFRWPLDCRSQ